MKLPAILATAALIAASPALSAPAPRAHHAHAKAPPKTPAKVSADNEAADKAKRYFFKPSEVRSSGTVTVGGQPIAYDFIAGTLVVHAKDWEDTDTAEADADTSSSDKDKNGAQARSVDVLHRLLQAGRAGRRPADHLPVQWRPGLVEHLGAHGRVRAGSRGHRRRPAHGPAPYSTVNNDQSLLDASDLVFIDAPGTGFSRIAGKDKEKAFYGVDQDIHAFTDFITQFLTKYDRWNSPKYVFGESYGTMRARRARPSRCKRRTST